MSSFILIFYLTGIEIFAESFYCSLQSFMCHKVIIFGLYNILTINLDMSKTTRILSKQVSYNRIMLISY